jgi:exonuclease VII small subunit
MLLCTHKHGHEKKLCLGGATAGYYLGIMGWSREVREIIAQLEQQRTRLEDVRERARRQGGPEGERLEAQATARLRQIEQQIDDLRATLE